MKHLVIGLLLTSAVTTVNVKNSSSNLKVQKPVSRDTLNTEPIVDMDSVLVDALEHLKNHEGFRSEIYYDTDGSRTIGYGHHLLKGEHYTYVSEKKATEILLDDFKKRQRHVEERYSVFGKPAIALTLFSFNCGIGNLKKLMKRNPLNNPEILLEYCHYTSKGVVHKSKSLLARRQYELNLIKY